jgi:hypothetical protein
LSGCHLFCIGILPRFASQNWFRSFFSPSFSRRFERAATDLVQPPLRVRHRSGEAATALPSNLRVSREHLSLSGCHLSPCIGVSAEVPVPKDGNSRCLQGSANAPQQTTCRPRCVAACTRSIPRGSAMQLPCAPFGVSWLSCDFIRTRVPGFLGSDALQ